MANGQANPTTPTKGTGNTAGAAPQGLGSALALAGMGGTTGPMAPPSPGGYHMPPMAPPGGFSGAPMAPPSPGGFQGAPTGQISPGGYHMPPMAPPSPGGFQGAPMAPPSPGGFQGAPMAPPSPGGFQGAPMGQMSPQQVQQAIMQNPQLAQHLASGKPGGSGGQTVPMQNPFSTTPPSRGNR